MQIRRGYRGGNEVKHNILDSILSNTVLGKEKRKSQLTLLFLKLQQILSKGR